MKEGKMLKSKKMKIVLLSVLGLVLVAGVIIYLQRNGFLYKASDGSNGKPSEEETVVSEAKAPADNELLVKFKSTTTKDKKDKFLAKHGATIKDSIDKIGVDVLTISTPNSPEEKAKEIRIQDSADIEFIEPNEAAQVMETTVNDPYYASWQGGLKYIQAPLAWDITTGSESVKIATVDTGADYTHPDLTGKLLPGYDFFDNDSNAMDENHHGTHVAGIIGAVANNGIGIAGIAWKNPILPVKVYDALGNSLYSIVAKGIIYAADQGAKVINLSLGGPTSNSTLQSAVDYAYNKGVVIAAASGNNGTLGVLYPAAYPNVIAVGATDGNDQLSSISSYGPELDVIAQAPTLSTCLISGYESMGGTSMSTAYVTAVVGLVRSVNPNLTAAQVMNIIRQSADDKGDPGWDMYTGYGRLNAFKAVTLAGGLTPPVPTTGVLSGWVTETVTGRPIIGATVTAKQAGVTKSSTVAMSNGSYAMSLNVGTYDLTFSSANYVSQTKTGVAVTAGGTTTSSAIMSLIPVPDTTVPTVSLTSPATGSSVKIGTKVAISATATDNVGITKVELYVNGSLKTSDTSSPYTYSWNTRGKGAVAGTYTIMAKAYDAAGNIAVSTVSVTLTK